MENANYDTAIIGATFYGCGAALNLPGKTLLVESGGAIGDDFVASLNEKPYREISPITAWGQRFFCDLQRRGAATKDGAVYLAPAAYVLSDYLKTAQIPLSLLTRVVGIEPYQTGYRLRLYQNSGFCEITAANILDTTALGILHKQVPEKKIEKTLRIVVMGLSAQQLKSEGMDAVFNPLSRLTVLSLPLDLTDDWTTARMKLHKFWADKGLSTRGGRVAFVSTAFAYSLSPGWQKIDAHGCWSPSCAWQNPVEALDQANWEQEEWNTPCC